MATTIFSSCNRAYEGFVLPYAAAALHHNDDAAVEVCVEAPARFGHENKQGVEVLGRHFPHRLLIRGGGFGGVLPHSVRFLEEPRLRADATYIGDIDILLLERDIAQAHRRHMVETGLPYSNVLRPQSERLTGLHFTETAAHYPLIRPADLDLKGSDEHLLYRLVQAKGLPLPDPADAFRPVHGYHLSLNRAPTAAPDHLSWGLAPAYLDAYLALVATSVWDEVAPHFPPAFAFLLHVLNAALQAQYPDRTIYRPTEARRLFWALAPSTETPAIPPQLAAGRIPAADAPDQPSTVDATEPAATASSAPSPPAPPTRKAGADADAERIRGVFTRIHDENRWQGASVSGPGSTLRTTELLRRQLPPLFAELGIRSLCDAPCGDASWITEVTAGLDAYAGYDVVEQLIAQNRERYPLGNHVFQVGDVVADVLPRADAILCRDCLVHLPLEYGTRAIANFIASGSTYLLATTFPTVEENRQSGVGGWRPLNLTRPPFNLPPPLAALRERPPNPNDPYNDKVLGVWALAGLAVGSPVVAEAATPTVVAPPPPAPRPTGETGMKMHPYSTHQALLVAALAHTEGPIIELGGGWYSTPLVSSFSAAGNRPALTVETGAYVFGLLRGLRTPRHRIVLLGGFDFDQVGKFTARPGRGVPDYKRLQAEYLDTLADQGFGRVSVAFVDQAPGFLRAPAIEFFADKADFIITHDTEHTEHYHFEPLLSSFKYRWDFTVHRPQSVVLSNTRDCSIFGYLGMPERP